MDLGVFRKLTLNWIYLNGLRCLLDYWSFTMRPDMRLYKPLQRNVDSILTGNFLTSWVIVNIYRNSMHLTIR
jgi:hypothetical protein